ncbi:hypothetical protein [Streptomyces radicis]|uniref:Uncharacterized protein n=1 Tax=Streptomyces radicis TaxID=1750517 RepID=A0A3A9WE02_9ACTN|nr:hypothetical protein [Streptomyces radicis]RKN10533.1 hypothetical protein D7319_08880 [Streptomyces radicis]RKN24792.1 hypothetical protein D7318_10055 [Streptomyces radicis]
MRAATPAPLDQPFEIRIGVYATAEDAARVATGCRRLLDAGPSRFSLALAERPRGDDLYEELPEQWRAEYPGADPGARAVHEVTVDVVTTRERANALCTALTHTICPDPDHASPCPIPWSSACLRGRPSDGMSGR